MDVVVRLELGAGAQNCYLCLMRGQACRLAGMIAELFFSRGLSSRLVAAGRQSFFVAFEEIFVFSA